MLFNLSVILLAVTSTSSLPLPIPVSQSPQKTGPDTSTLVAQPRLGASPEPPSNTAPVDELSQTICPEIQERYKVLFEEEKEMVKAGTFPNYGDTFKPNYDFPIVKTKNLPSPPRSPKSLADFSTAGQEYRLENPFMETRNIGWKGQKVREFVLQDIHQRRFINAAHTRAKARKRQGRAQATTDSGSDSMDDVYSKVANAVHMLPESDNSDTESVREEKNEEIIASVLGTLSVQHLRPPEEPSNADPPRRSTSAKSVAGADTDLVVPAAAVVTPPDSKSHGSLPKKRQRSLSSTSEADPPKRVKI